MGQRALGGDGMQSQGLAPLGPRSPAGPWVSSARTQSLTQARSLARTVALPWILVLKVPKRCRSRLALLLCGQAGALPVRGRLGAEQTWDRWQ